MGQSFTYANRKSCASFETADVRRISLLPRIAAIRGSYYHPNPPCDTLTSAYRFWERQP
jgi:hypothetical protein